MIFGDGAFAQQIGRDRDVHPLGHSHDQAAEPIAGQLDAGENDRFLRRANQRDRFFEVRRRACADRILRALAGGSAVIGISRSTMSCGTSM